MRFEQTRDVFKHVEKFHREVERFYHGLEAKTDKARVKLLLEYLGKREKDLAKALKEFEQETSAQVLDTWFQYSHDVERLECPESTLGQEMSVDEVIEQALKIQKCLIAFYRGVAETADIDEIRAVFANLADRGEQETRKIARNSQLLMDM